MTFVEQTKRRHCGQVALAALTDLSLDHVIRIVGHERSTKTVELITALHRLGFECPDHMQRVSLLHAVGAFGLAQLRRPGRTNWHWVAVGDGLVYDGCRTGPILIEDYKAFQLKADDARITSFLPVRRTQ